MLKLIISLIAFIKSKIKRPVKYNLYLNTNKRIKNTISNTEIGFEIKLNKNYKKEVLLNVI